MIPSMREEVFGRLEGLTTLPGSTPRSGIFLFAHESLIKCGKRHTSFVGTLVDDVQCGYPHRADR